jgi:hypothetical protein
MDASAIGNIANTLAHLMLHRNINAGRDEWARHLDVVQTCATSASADSMSGFGYAT